MDKHFKTTMVLLITLLMSHFSFGQPRQVYHPKQSIRIPLQGKTLDFDIADGHLTGISSLPIPSGSQYDNVPAENKYDGSAPLYVQQMVTDNHGRLLFFIQDNRIYDYRGLSCASDDVNKPLIYTGEGSKTDEDNDEFDEPTEIPKIRQVQVVTLDGDCYKYLLVWHEVEKTDNSNEHSLSDFYYQYVFVNPDKSLSFLDDNNQISSTISSAKFLYGHLHSGTHNDDMWPAGFAISKFRSDGTRFLFLHDDQQILTYSIDENGLNTHPIHENNFYNEGNTESRTFWDETELMEKDGYYYYVCANAGSHDTLLALSFIKLNADGEKVFSTYKDVGHSKKNFIKGIEFSQNGDYLYFTSVGYPLRYLATDFLFSETAPGDIHTIDAIDTNYQYSHIELGRDQQFYLINGGTKTLTAIGNTDDPDNLQITTDVAANKGINNLKINSNYDFGNGSSCYKNYALTKQVDGSDYTSYYDNIELNEYECCADHFEYDEQDTNRHITSSGTWTPDNNPFQNGVSELYFRGNLTIEPGVNITVKDLTLHFREGKGIVLKSSNIIRGAKLTLDHSTCTAFDQCNNNAVMWKGIVLEGNNTAQFFGKQPEIDLKNSAMIEYAKIGIKSMKGAIVIADHSTFKDNVVATEFADYKNNIKSKFTENSFITTDVFPMEKHQSRFMYSSIHQARNIKFYGNTFVANHKMNLRSMIGLKIEQGSAIVDENNDVRSLFKELDYGILAYQSTGMNVQHTDFVENTKGIRLAQSSNSAIILDNDFDVADYCYSEPNMHDRYPSFGLSIETSPGFTVENNIFHDGLAGMYVIDNGDNANDAVRRNQFHHLKNNKESTGLIAKGENGETNSGEDDGLEFRCNQFIDNDYAIAVIDGNIAKSQYGDRGTGPAGNWFDHNHSMDGATDFYIKNSPIELYDYHQHSRKSVQELRLDWDNSDPLLITTGDPGDYYTYSKIEIAEVGNSVDSSWEKACPDHHSGTAGRKDDAVSYVIDQADALAQLANEKEIDLNVKIDAGKTDDLLKLIDGLSQWNYHQTVAELLKVGQYLSNEVLLRLMKNPVYNPPEKYIALSANSPLPLALRKEIDHLNWPVYLKDRLKKQQNGLYKREADALEITALRAKRERLVSQAVAFALSNDTVPEKLDSLMEWLAQKDNLKSIYRLVPLYIAKGQYSQADSALDVLVQLASQQGAKAQKDAEDYRTLQKLNMDIYQNFDRKHDIVDAYRSELEAIASQTGKNAGVAKDILYEFDTTAYADYQPAYPLPTPMPLGKNNQSLFGHSNQTGMTASSVSVYPNPANGVLHVTYTNADDYTALYIYSMQGRVLKQVDIQDTYGRKTLNISDLSKGMYFIGFTKDNAVKFVVK